MIHLRARIVVATALLAQCAACSSDEDGSALPFVYSGRVRLSLAGGLAAAPDGTPVSLAPLDAQGNLGPELVSTTTVAGAYTLEFTGRAPGALALVAGSGSERPRTLCVDTATDVDPFGEVALRLMLEQGVPLARFTAEEARDLAGSIELLAVVEAVELDADLEATAARLRTAAVAHAGFVDFLAAAGGAGQTARAPGDLGGHFPLRTDDQWGYRWTFAESGFLVATKERERRTLLPVGTAFEVRTRFARDEGSTFHERFEADERVVRRFDGEDFDALLGGVPDVRLAFPLRAGKRWLALEARRASFGRDLDFDTLPETLDARLVRTVAGFEDVETPDGTFADCVRVDGSGPLTLYPTGGAGPRPGTLTQSEWYAAGLGLVRRQTVVEVPSFFTLDLFEEVLSARLVGGVGHGVQPAVVLDADLGTDPITSVRSASDGTNHLLVEVREHGDERPLVALLVDGRGDILRESELFRLTPRTSSGERQETAVTFDGTNFVVAHADERLWYVQRVARDGELLDPLPIRITNSPIEADFNLSAASDGEQTLLVWQHYRGLDPWLMQACFVTSSGSPLDVFPLLESQASGSLALAYGADSYLLVFQDFDAVKAFRIDHDGTLLDPEGIVLHAGAVSEFPEFALAFDGENWLVGWTRKVGGSGDPTYHFNARRLGGDGELLDALEDPPLAITTSFAGKHAPTLAFDGTHWLAAWVKTTAPTAIHLARLTRTGERLDGTSADDGRTILGPFQPGHLDHAAETILSPAADHVLLHWLQRPAAAGRKGRSEAAAIYPLD